MTACDDDHSPTDRILASTASSLGYETMLLGRHRRPLERTFVSAKTRRAIPHAGGLVGDALVQATLDARFTEIDVLDPPLGMPESVGALIVLRTADGVLHLDVEPARPLRTPADEDAMTALLATLEISPHVLTGRDVMTEPRFSTCRAVWRYRHVRVAPSMRFGLLAALRDEGSIALGELCNRKHGPQDPFGCILALACSNELSLDLSTPLGPTTIVRSLS